MPAASGRNDTPRLDLHTGLAIAISAAVAIAAAAPAPTGTLKGRVKLSGEAPGNKVIRMGMDPMCAKMWAGKKPGPVDEVVVTSDDGGLMNAFVKLDGSFPGTPVPAQPVLLDQRGCFYHPRVVGARVGQVLRIKNSDNLLHNVHSSSSHRNSFNFGQPQAGISSDFKLADEEMLKLGCDVHRWMTAWVGVVDHPYFAVSGADGSFVISNVPAGKRTISVWHERFGTLTKGRGCQRGRRDGRRFCLSGRREVLRPRPVPVLGRGRLTRPLRDSRGRNVRQGNVWLPPKRGCRPDLRAGFVRLLVLARQARPGRPRATDGVRRRRPIRRPRSVDRVAPADGQRFHHTSVPVTASAGKLSASTDHSTLTPRPPNDPTCSGPIHFIARSPALCFTSA